MAGAGGLSRAVRDYRPRRPEAFAARWGLRAACAAVVALATLATVATVPPATTAATAATACSRETVDGGKYLGRLTLRFVLIGPVSCGKAHRLARTYFHKFARGQCGQGNNRCILDFPGGWTCSLFTAGESPQAGGAMAGCARAQPGAKIRLFKAGSHPKRVRRTTASFFSPSGNVSCEMTDDTRLPRPHVYCQSTAHPHSVQMGLSGRLKICHRGTIQTTHCLGNPGENTRVLRYGKHIRISRFRCRSEHVGVTCTVVKTGKGFLIDRDRVKPVGP